MIWLYAFAVIGYVIAGGIFASLFHRFTSFSKELALKGAFIWPFAIAIIILVAVFCVVAEGTDLITDWIEKKVSNT